MNIKHYSKEDMTVVKCSSCGNEMECPKSMLKAEKHICHICTDTLAYGVRQEDAKEIAETEQDVESHKKEMLELGEFIHGTSFCANLPSKDEMKEISKKELAEMMHFNGIMSATDFFINSCLDGSALKEILRVIKVSRHYGPKNDEDLKSFVHETKKVMDIVGAIGEKLEEMKVGKKEFGRIMKSVDAKHFENITEAEHRRRTYKRNEQAYVQGRLERAR